MPDLDLAAANRMTEAALAFAEQNALRLAIAILDNGGNVVRVTRMDGCNFLSPARSPAARHLDRPPGRCRRPN
jgi:uncharacterized protein GlcG (DUF336 family)